MATGKCEIVAVEFGSAVTGLPEYSLIYPGAKRLIPSKITVQLDNVPPGLPALRIPERALPFGLLHSIRLVGGWLNAVPEGIAAPMVYINAEKCSKDVTFTAAGVAIVGAVPAATDSDSGDADIFRVTDETGHCMQWRMMSAGSIREIFLRFKHAEVPRGTPVPITLPPSFRIEFIGANVVDAAVDLSPENKTIGTSLMFPYLFPKERQKRFIPVDAVLLKHTQAYKEKEAAEHSKREG